jgi:hypothetical protein
MRVPFNESQFVITETGLDESIFTRTKFASGGDAVVFFSFEEVVSYRFEYSPDSWEQVGPVYYPRPLRTSDEGPANANSDFDIATSYDGSILASVDDSFDSKSHVDVVNANFNKCESSEFEIFVSVMLDRSPFEASWAIETIKVIGNAVIPVDLLAACDGCYKAIDVYSRANVIESVCLDSSHSPQCIRLMLPEGRFDGTSATRYAAFVKANSTLVPIGSSSTGNGLSIPLAELKEECSQEPTITCSADESVFALALTLGDVVVPPLATWKLQSSSGVDLNGGGNYTQGGYKSGETVLYELCIPRNETSTFTIWNAMDFFGRGTFSVFLDWNEIPATARRRTELQSIPVGPNKTFVMVTLAVNRVFEAIWSISSNRDGMVAVQSVLVVREGLQSFRQSYFLLSNESYTLSLNTTGYGDPTKLYQVYVGDDDFTDSEIDNNILADASWQTPSNETLHSFVTP